MNWEAIGAVGEVIGAAGVIFSLVYLATQIRASSKQANADAIYDLQKGQADVMATFSGNPELLEAESRLALSLVEQPELALSRSTRDNSQNVRAIREIGDPPEPLSLALCAIIAAGTIKTH